MKFFVGDRVVITDGSYADSTFTIIDYDIQVMDYCLYPEALHGWYEFEDLDYITVEIIE